MAKNGKRQAFTRRDFIKMGGGMIGAAAGAALFRRALLEPDVVEASAGVYIPPRSVSPSVNAQAAAADKHFIASDGWIYLPEDAPVPPFHPDTMGPDPFNCYIFGFRDVTPVTNNKKRVYAQKMKAQLTAPLFWIEQEADFTLKVTNLGLEIRPDLVDAHTLHFHGFRNAIPIFDGEPHSSVGVPIARDLTYFYRPHDPGTYMYHCHFEETEHVHMGMVGPCFVAPIQNYDGYGGDPATIATLGGGTDPAAPRGYVFNDGDGSTAYDREFIMLVSEIWTESHWSDSHVQLPEWSDYNPEFYLLNGRVWPDTLLPNGLGTDLQTGDLIPPPGHPELQYQPVSSLVQVNEGERVLFRMINLGFEEQAMHLSGIRMRVVGKDATILRGRGGADFTYQTSTVPIGPGESTDAIFLAPPYQADPLGYNRYLFYTRNYQRLSNGGHGGYGGAMTEVRVFPTGTLDAQTAPNT
jgi:FtsP/CotA-like multicopper oxidase with cupredoxin domain